MLKLDNISTFYGHLQALWGISLEVKTGELVALVGPNGAGKTTTLKVIAGLLKPAEGQVEFQGQDLLKKPAYQIVSLGISQVPEGGRIFPGLNRRLIHRGNDLFPSIQNVIALQVSIEMFIPGARSRRFA